MKEVTATPDLLNALSTPESMAQLADLVYVSDQHLNIYRKKYGRGFSYFLENSQRLDNREQLRRVKSLVIPPAWQQVRISSLPNGHLQVVGRDDKNRKVYLYHELWSVLRNQTKFFKMSAFAKALPKIRSRLSKDLDQKGMPQSKCLALVLSIMDETYIRIGSEQYARRNKTYGLTTLRTRHVKEQGADLVFNFTGKKGVKQTKSIEDPDLVALINECEEIPGWELFQYYDAQGGHQSVESGMINNYLQDIAGDIFTAKDFRTWGATREYFEHLIALPEPADDKERDANVLSGYDAAAYALGNTRSVCRQYYVHPQLPESYKATGFSSYRSALKEQKDGTYFSAAERCIQEIIDDFEVAFDAV